MTNTTLADLRVLEVANLLARLVPGAIVELSPGEQVVLDRVCAAGLATRTTDRTTSRAALEAKKDALARSTDPLAIARLRIEVLDLSESLASADGAATVHASAGDGPYRSGATPGASYALTQGGRALLSNLGPRAARAADLPVSDFALQLSALEMLFAARARRAADLVARVQPRISGSLPPHALRSAMIGLASLSEPVDALGDAFFVLFTAIRQVYTPSPCTPAQDASAAESLILHAGSSRGAYQTQTAQSFVVARDELARRFCENRSEDALDAMLLLASFDPGQHEPRIQRAARFAAAMARAGVPTPLSVALFVTVADESTDLVPTVTRAYSAIRRWAPDLTEALTAAALLTSQSAYTPETQLERMNALYAYLSRGAPQGMVVAAALLALLDGEPAGLLDDLRLAGKHVVEQRLTPGGTEATSLALKLLLHSALLARGSEGDPEESLALAVRALPDVAALAVGTQGLGTMSATLPMLTSSVVAFHRPMLDAAVIYEQHSRPMHSDYVFGGNRGTGYGGYHPTSHRSFGWG